MIPTRHGKDGQFEVTVPVIADRMLQAIAVSALEPEWEARFEPKSYGFRPGRGCHDAIEAIFNTVSGKNPQRRWILDADLAAAFDRIDHDHILAQIGTFPARELVVKWLKSGVIEKGWLTPAEEGIPQGGLCSAEHKPPYAQCRVMRSAGVPVLVVAGSAGERCA